MLTLRNGANGEQQYKFTLREALDIPAYVNTTITLTKAFADQAGLTGLEEGEAINIDTELTVTLPGSSVYVFDGVDGATADATPEVITLPVTKYGIATFCAEHETVIPQGAKVYVATETPEVPEEGLGEIRMTELTGVVPANTGVVVLAKEGNYDFVATNDVAEEVDGNLLKGYADRAEYDVVLNPANATNYVLAVQNDVAAFYKKEAHFKVYKNRAYLQLPTSQPVKGFRMVFENNDGTTEISDVILGGGAQQTVFDLQGRRVQTPKKGVYVVGGKKVIY